jgi:UDP-arabinose 4-epimerase
MKSFFSILFLFTTQILFATDNKTVLVVGGAGYIGSHTCKALYEAGFTPVTYDSIAAGSEKSVKWGPLVVGDLFDTETLDKAFIDYKPLAVLHFAALRNVRESLKDPAVYYSNNVAASINLLNIMLKHKVEEIIFSSSCTVYGHTDVSPIPESHPKAPINPYAMSKYVIETAIKDYAKAYALKYMILRYFNAAGIELESGLKRSPHSYNFLIPEAMLTILSPKAPLQIFGDDFPTPDGTAIRDYVHVKDLADAHVLALKHLLDGKKSDEINLGTGKGYSVLEIIHAIEKVSGKKVSYEIKPRIEGELAETVAEIKKSEEVLDFKPRFSDLETIIKTEWLSMVDNQP